MELILWWEQQSTYKGEKVKEWKGEKMAAPLKGKRWKGEKVKEWKGEKMANATYSFGLTPYLLSYWLNSLTP